ncbi:MAG TPA: FadR/GntR family transcriptional regulator [Thermomicrobiales bacterium]|nr:FadR/GntR family transcriptional regulator [Thermomicrobiales bacterium]
MHPRREKAAVATESGSLRREALHLAIQDRLKRFIIERGYQSGDPLPAEAELAHLLGISRPSLREAMKALQTLGVVDIRHGSGTYVGRFTLTPLMDSLAFSIRIDLGRNIRTVRELLEIREILERELVARAAGIVTADQIVALSAIVDRMAERGARGEMFTEEDRAFHEILYQPLGNPMVVQLLHAFWQVFFAVRDDLPGMQADLAATAEGHRAIVAALAQRDRAAASAAMTAHFDGIQRRLSAPVAVAREPA